jgi:hopanoid biosynthesis associated protein HpnK
VDAGLGVGAEERTEKLPRALVVVNADDFGRSEEVVAAVIRAHDRGILTSASLMVTGEAADAAVRAARERPGLGVGLHLTLLRGRAVLPPEEIPHLVDHQGCFSGNAFSAGCRYFFGRAARSELAREIRAQFEAFAATGLPLSHVDGHHHLHLHPTVFALLLPLARDFEARAVRVNVADELLFSLRLDPRRPLLKLGWKITFSLLGLHCRRRLWRWPVGAADRVYGLMQSGNLTAAYLERLFARLGGAGAGSSGRSGPAALPAAAAGASVPRPPVIEIFCHPSLRAESGALGPNPGDLEALLSPRTEEAARAAGVVLTTYSLAFPL